MSTYTRHRPMQAFLLAVAAEAGLLIIGTLVLSGVASTPAISTPVPITLVSEEAPPAPPAPPAKPEPVPPQHQPKVAPAKPHLPTPPRKQATPPVAQAPLPVTPAPAETANAFSEPTPTPPPPAPAATGKADPNAEYAAKVRAAVLAAVYYPPAAATLNYSGRVRVEFHLRDAVSSAARVVVASGIGMIDRAALQTVQNASYPAPPADMRGKDTVYQVWVEFNHH